MPFQLNISSSAAKVIELEKKTNQGKLIGTREFKKFIFVNTLCTITMYSGALWATDVLYSHLCLNSWPTHHLSV